MFDREEFRLGVPAPGGGIEVGWSPGSRGSVRATVLRCPVRYESTLRIDPQERRSPSRASEIVTTGDAQYNALFQIACADHAGLEKVFDREFRDLHRETPAGFIISKGMLESSVDRIIEDEDELIAFLKVFIAFRTRIQALG
jgi:hypothetical protein